jgi:hypothetical protein
MGDDGAARPSAHARPESVGLRSTAVVRLKCALGHRSPLVADVVRTRYGEYTGASATGRRGVAATGQRKTVKTPFVAAAVENLGAIVAPASPAART